MRVERRKRLFGPDGQRHIHETRRRRRIWVDLDRGGAVRPRDVDQPGGRIDAGGGADGEEHVAVRCVCRRGDVAGIERLAEPHDARPQQAAAPIASMTR